MSNEVVFAVLASVVLLGAALVAVLRTDRVRETRQQRLKAVTAMAPIGGQPTVSLRRPLRQRGARGLFSPLSALWARLDAALAATGNWIGVPHLAVTGVVAAAAAILLAERVMRLNPVLVIVLAVAAAAAGPALLLWFAQTRYQRHFLDAFPDALDLIGRAVRAGLPAVEAMEVAGREIRPPVGIEFQRTLEEVRLGIDIGEALEHTAERIRVPDFRFYVVALALQRRTGGALAETLRNLSNIIRRRKEMRLKARALSAEAKASAAVLAILPFVVGALLFALNPSLMSILFHDARGRYMLGLAALSLITGIAVMALIIRRALRY
jgi:Flp pilus assembly protein TadB